MKYSINYDCLLLLCSFYSYSYVLYSAIHRRLIPRYFRSLYTGGVSKVYFLVFDSKENYMNTTVTLDCKQASMVTHYTKPTDTKVLRHFNIFCIKPIRTQYIMPNAFLVLMEVLPVKRLVLRALDRL